MPQEYINLSEFVTDERFQAKDLAGQHDALNKAFAYNEAQFGGSVEPLIGTPEGASIPGAVRSMGASFKQLRRAVTDRYIGEKIGSYASANDLDPAAVRERVMATAMGSGDELTNPEESGLAMEIAKTMYETIPLYDLPHEEKGGRQARFAIGMPNAVSSEEGDFEAPVAVGETFRLNGSTYYNMVFHNGPDGQEITNPNDRKPFIFKAPEVEGEGDTLWGRMDNNLRIEAEKLDAEADALEKRGPGYSLGSLDGGGGGMSETAHYAKSIARLREGAQAARDKRALYADGWNGYTQMMADIASGAIKGDEEMLRHVPQAGNPLVRIGGEAGYGLIDAYLGTAAGAQYMTGFEDAAKRTMKTRDEFAFERDVAGMGDRHFRGNVLDNIATELPGELAQTATDIAIGGLIVRGAKAATMPIARMAAKRVGISAGAGVVGDAIGAAARKQAVEKASKWLASKSPKLFQAIAASGPGALEEASGVISKVAEADEMDARAQQIEAELAKIPKDSAEFADARLTLEQEAADLRARAEKIHQGAAYAFYATMATTMITDTYGFERILGRGGKKLSQAAAKEAVERFASKSRLNLSKEAVEAAAEKLYDGVENAAGMLIETSGIENITTRLKNGAVEGITEVLQGVLNNAAMKAFVDENQELFQGDSALSEFGVGFMVSAVLTHISKGVQPEHIKKALTMASDRSNVATAEIARTNERLQEAESGKGIQGFGSTLTPKDVVKQKGDKFVIEDPHDVVSKALPMGAFGALTFDSREQAEDFAKNRWRTAYEAMIREDFAKRAQTGEGKNLDEDNNPALSEREVNALIGTTRIMANASAAGGEFSTETFYAAQLQSQEQYRPEQVSADASALGTAAQMLVDHPNVPEPVRAAIAAHIKSKAPGLPTSPEAAALIEATAQRLTDQSGKQSQRVFTLNQADAGNASDAFIGIPKGGDIDMSVEPIRDDKGNIVDTRITRINPSKVVEKYNATSPSEIARRKAGIGSPASNALWTARARHHYLMISQGQKPANEKQADEWKKEASARASNDVKNARRERSDRPSRTSLSTSRETHESDHKKAAAATKFIGRGSPGSTPAAYAEDFGKTTANSGSYSQSDVVFVAAESDRPGRVAPDFAEIRNAVAAGATIVTDNPTNRNRPNSIGEREVADFLIRAGYHEASTRDMSVWTRTKFETDVQIDPESNGVTLRDSDGNTIPGTPVIPVVWMYHNYRSNGRSTYDAILTGHRSGTTRHGKSLLEGSVIFIQNPHRPGSGVFAVVRSSTTLGELVAQAGGDKQKVLKMLAEREGYTESEFKNKVMDQPGWEAQKHTTFQAVSPDYAVIRQELDAATFSEWIKGVVSGKQSTGERFRDLSINLLGSRVDEMGGRFDVAGGAGPGSTYSSLRESLSSSKTISSMLDHAWGLAQQANLGPMEQNEHFKAFQKKSITLGQFINAVRDQAITEIANQAGGSMGASMIARFSEDEVVTSTQLDRITLSSEQAVERRNKWKKHNRYLSALQMGEDGRFHAPLGEVGSNTGEIRYANEALQEGDFVMVHWDDNKIRQRGSQFVFLGDLASKAKDVSVVVAVDKGGRHRFLVKRIYGQNVMWFEAKQMTDGIKGWATSDDRQAMMAFFLFASDSIGKDMDIGKFFQRWDQIVAGGIDNVPDALRAIPNWRQLVHGWTHFIEGEGMDNPEAASARRKALVDGAIAQIGQLGKVDFNRQHPSQVGSREPFVQRAEGEDPIDNGPEAKDFRDFFDGFERGLSITPPNRLGGFMEELTSEEVGETLAEEVAEGDVAESLRSAWSQNFIEDEENQDLGQSAKSVDATFSKDDGQGAAESILLKILKRVATTTQNKDVESTPLEDATAEDIVSDFHGGYGFNANHVKLVVAALSDAAASKERIERINANLAEEQGAANRQAMDEMRQEVYAHEMAMIAEGASFGAIPLPEKMMRELVGTLWWKNRVKPLRDSYSAIAFSEKTTPAQIVEFVRSLTATMGRPDINDLFTKVNESLESAADSDEYMDSLSSLSENFVEEAKNQNPEALVMIMALDLLEKQNAHVERRAKRRVTTKIYKTMQQLGIQKAVWKSMLPEGFVTPSSGDNVIDPSNEDIDFDEAASENRRIPIEEVEQNRAAPRVLTEVAEGTEFLPESHQAEQKFDKNGNPIDEEMFVDGGMDYGAPMTEGDAYRFVKFMKKAPEKIVEILDASGVDYKPFKEIIDAAIEKIEEPSPDKMIGLSLSKQGPAFNALYSISRAMREAAETMETKIGTPEAIQVAKVVRSAGALSWAFGKKGATGLPGPKPATMAKGIPITSAVTENGINISDLMDMIPRDATMAEKKAFWKQLISGSSAAREQWREASILFSDMGPNGHILTKDPLASESHEEALVQLYREGWKPTNSPRPALFQKTPGGVKRGTIRLFADTLPSITFGRHATVSTFIHEMTHWMNHVQSQSGNPLLKTMLGDNGYAELMDYATKGGTIHADTKSGFAEIEERIAYGIEKYFSGVGEIANMGAIPAGPVAILGKVIRNVWVQIYRNRDYQIPANVRAAFDAVFLPNVDNAALDGLTAKIRQNKNAVIQEDALIAKLQQREQTPSVKGQITKAANRRYKAMRNIVELKRASQENDSLAKTLADAEKKFASKQTPENFNAVRAARLNYAVGRSMANPVDMASKDSVIDFIKTAFGPDADINQINAALRQVDKERAMMGLGRHMPLGHPLVKVTNEGRSADSLDTVFAAVGSSGLYDEASEMASEVPEELRPHLPHMTTSNEDGLLFSYTPSAARAQNRTDIGKIRQRFENTADSKSLITNFARAIYRMGAAIRGRGMAPKSLFLALTQSLGGRDAAEGEALRIQAEMELMVVREAAKAGLSPAARGRRRRELNQIINTALSNPDMAERANALLLLNGTGIDIAVMKARDMVDQWMDELINEGVVFGPMAATWNAKKGFFMHRTYMLRGGSADGQKTWAKNAKGGRLWDDAVAELMSAKRITADQASALLDDLLKVVESNHGGKGVFSGDLLSSEAVAMMRDPNRRIVAVSDVAAEAKRRKASLRSVNEELRFMAEDERPGMPPAWADNIYKQTIFARDIQGAVAQAIGIQTEPQVQFMNAIRTMSSALTRHRAEASVRDAGLKAGWIRRADDQKGANELSALFTSGGTAETAGTPAEAMRMGALAGYASTPEVVEWWNTVVEHEFEPAKVNMFIAACGTVNGIWKMAHTVFSATTSIGNAFSSFMAGIGTGHFLNGYGEAGKMILAHEFGHRDTVKNLLGQAQVDHLKASFDEMVKTGELEAGTLNDILDLFRHTPQLVSALSADLLTRPGSSDGINELMRMSKSAINNVKKAHIGFYRYGDSYPKLAVMLAESESLSAAFPNKSQEEIRAMAAERTGRAMFSFRREPHWMRKFKRNIPIIGTFFSYGYGITRAYLNGLKIAASDIKEGVQRMRAGEAGGSVQKNMGLKRAAGLAIASYGIMAIKSAINSMLGWDDERDKAARQMLPEWDRDGVILYQDDYQPGKPARYVNLGRLLPFLVTTNSAENFSALVAGIVTNAAKGDMEAANRAIDEHGYAAFKGLIDPFLAETESSKLATSLVRGEFSSPSMDTLETIRAMMEAIAKDFTPGTISDLSRAGIITSDSLNRLGFKARTDEKGEKYAIHERMLYMLGYKYNLMDPTKGIVASANRHLIVAADAKKILSQTLAYPDKIAPEKLMEAIKKAKGIMDESAHGIAMTIEAAKTLGLRTEDVVRAMKGAKVQVIPHVGSSITRQQIVSSLIGSWRGPIGFSRSTLINIIESSKKKDPERMELIKQAVKEGLIQFTSGR